MIKTMKFFIWLQLIAYEYIHFDAGTSLIKESYSFLPRGRSAWMIGGISGNTWNSKNSLNKSLLEIAVFRRLLDRLINRQFSMSLLARHSTLTRILKSMQRRHGEGTQQMLYWEAPPRGLTPYPFLYRFPRKRFPFRTPSIDKWYPFHIPCLELCIPFTVDRMHCILSRNQSQKQNVFSTL